MIRLLFDLAQKALFGVLGDEMDGYESMSNDEMYFHTK